MSPDWTNEIVGSGGALQPQTHRDGPSVPPTFSAKYCRIRPTGIIAITRKTASIHRLQAGRYAHLFDNVDVTAANAIEIALTAPRGTVAEP
jgi:hypothetical protein